MRTTIVLADDVDAAIQELRRDRSVGLSEVVNDLIRAGLAAKPPESVFRQRSERVGIHVDVSNIAEALDLLEGPSAR